MKPFSLLLIPSAALLISSCASGPAEPGYGGPGYGHTDVYVEGTDRGGYDHHDGDDGRDRQNTTDVNDVTVNRTTVNDPTVNQSTVNSSSSTNVKQASVKKRKSKKAVSKPTPNP
jgi:hypothetical protein